MDFSFYVPTRLMFGAGSFRRAGKVIAELGRRVLLVTTRSAMDRLGHTQHLLDDLASESVAVERFCGQNSSPTTDDVDAGATLARDCRADVVVALGGGAVLDCAKAIAGVAPSKQPAVDFLYQRTHVAHDALPTVCIPTTAGTGSEMNRSAIIRDAEAGFKDGIRSDWMFPRRAIVDPLLTHSLPAYVTGLTGFDALAHAVESFVSPRASPLFDSLALSAIQTIARFLPRALAQPDDAEARERLAFASTIMGINLACVGTCFPHRADKSLCALRPEIPHGQSVALFYPFWIRHAYTGAAEKFNTIAQTLGYELQTQSTGDAARSCSHVFAEFIAESGLRLGLSTFGVNDSDIPRLVAGVAGDLSVNPAPIEQSELSDIFQEILAEKLG